RLRPLPDGLALGVPLMPVALARSGAVNPAGLARAGLDVALPRTRWPEDPSVAEVIGGRLGHEVLDRLVDPLIGGINAGRSDRLVRKASPAAAAELDGIRYASVAVATLGYRRGDVGHPLDGSGFLVPRVDGRLLTACTWFSSKWPALARDGRVLLRCSTGRDGDDRFAALDDDELVARLHAEAAEALGL